jgi:cyclase
MWTEGSRGKQRMRRSQTYSRDGARIGYDLELTRTIAAAVSVPVIASGGAGTADHVRAAIAEGGADAALVAGILHDGTTTVRALKDGMRVANLPVREVAA